MGNRRSSADDAKGRDALPFALADRHLAPRRSRAIRDALAVLVIGLPLAAALAGLLGGTDPATATVRAPGAELSITAPEVLRSGNWFEIEMEVVARADIADLTIAIDRPLWRRLSIDTMAPDAESAESLDGRYRYHFGPVARGETFGLKLDGQIQPAGSRRLEGQVTAGDGDRPVVAMPLGISVLP